MTDMELEQLVDGWRWAEAEAKHVASYDRDISWISLFERFRVRYRTHLSERERSKVFGECVIAERQQVQQERMRDIEGVRRELERRTAAGCRESILHA